VALGASGGGQRSNDLEVVAKNLATRAKVMSVKTDANGNVSKKNNTHKKDLVL
jgi:hypothetical protein